MAATHGQKRNKPIPRFASIDTDFQSIMGIEYWIDRNDRKKSNLTLGMFTYQDALQGRPR